MLRPSCRAIGTNVQQAWRADRSFVGQLRFPRGLFDFRQTRFRLETQLGWLAAERSEAPGSFFLGHRFALPQPPFATWTSETKPRVFFRRIKVFFFCRIKIFRQVSLCRQDQGAGFRRRDVRLDLAEDLPVDWRSRVLAVESWSPQWRCRRGERWPANWHLPSDYFRRRDLHQKRRQVGCLVLGSLIRLFSVGRQVAELNVFSRRA